MRSVLLVCLVFLVQTAFAQLPRFEAEARKAKLPQISLDAIGAEFTDFESLVFDEQPLLAHLRENQSLSRFELSLGSHEWVFEVEPFEFRSDDYVLRVQEETGIRELPRSETITYQGYTVGAKPAEIRLTVTDGFVYGFVAENNDAIFFQSQWLTAPGSDPSELLVFRGSDGILPAENGCGTGIDQGDGQGHDHKGDIDASARTANQCFEVEFAIASDFSMYTSYGSNIAGLEGRNLGVMAAVNSDYMGQFGDDYFFVVTEQFVSTCSTCDPWTSSNSASALLNSFTAWGGFNNSHDLGQLWTDRNFSGSTIGVAWVGAICTGSRYHVLQDFSSNADLTRVLVSHEIGHNFNCNHDAGGSPFIMAPAVQFTSTWSGTSIASVDAYAPNRPCLSTLSCGGGSVPPTASFTAQPTVICEGQTVQFTNTSQDALTYQWTFPGGNPATSNDVDPIVTYDVTGVYDVTLEAINTLGSDVQTQTQIIDVSALPNPDFTFAVVGPLEIDFTNISTDATSYQWGFGDGGSSTQINPSHTYTSPGTYNVILAAFNNCGSVSTTQIITVLVPPTADFTSSTQAGCAPHTVSFTDASTGVVQGYNWSFPGGNPSSSTIANPTVLYDAPGSYDVTLEVANSSGTDTDTRTSYVVVSDVPAAGFSVSVNNNQVTVTNTATGATSYSYDFGDGGTSTDENPTYTYTTGGTFTITQTVTNACGSASSTQSATVTAGPVASFVATQTAVCVGDQATVLSTSTGNPTSLLYTLVRPDGSTTTSANDPFTFQATAIGAYSISLTATNGSGQNTSSALIMDVTDAPFPSIQSLINGQQVDFTASVQAGVTADNYSWNFGDGNTGTGANASNVYAASGVYTVQLTATNSCGSNTTSATVTVGNAPSATITSSLSGNGCPGETVTYNANVSGTTTSIQWTLPGASPSNPTGSSVTVNYANTGSYAVSVEVCNTVGCNTQTLAGGTSIDAETVAGFNVSNTGQQITVNSTATGATSVNYTFGDGSGTSANGTANYTYANAGTYTITQTATGPCGSDISTQSVTVGQAPTANFGVSVPAGLLCAGAVIEFLDQSTGGATSFAWSFPGGTPSTSTVQNPSVTYNSPGTYNASLTVTNALGDNSTTQQNVVTIAAGPTADFTTLVNGLEAQFGSQAIGAASLSWNFGDGTTSTLAGPTHTYSQTGTYTVTLTATNPCGTDIITQQVSVLAAPTATFSQSATSGCAGLSVAFDASSSLDAASYEWNFPGGSPASSTQAAPTVSYANAGIYLVQLIVDNASGRDTSTLQQAVTVQPLAVAAFDSDVAMLSVNFTNNSSSATSFVWDFGDGNTSTQPNPTHVYAVNGTYTVTLSATNACGTDVITSTVVVAIGLPNAAIAVTGEAGCGPLTTQFSAQGSTGADTYQWTFAGGSPMTSSAFAPEVIYNQAGNYDVMLVVTNDSGTDTLLLMDVVTVLDVPTAIQRTPILNGFSVSFGVDATTGASIAWDFGDGTTLQNADSTEIHTYAAVGEYEVIVTVSNACGVLTDTVEVLIGAVPDAEFTTSVTRGCAPLEVTLMDISTGNPTAWNWTVTSPSGAEITSTDQNPNLTLTEIGSYSVSLQAINGAGAATEVSVNIINIIAEPTVDASVSGTDDLTVSFTSAVSAVDSVRWDFGDGTTSTATNPSHTYAATGTYTVTLTAYGLCGTVADEIMVSVMPSSVNELPAGASLRVFPNPMQDVSTLEILGLPNQALNVSLTDALGRVVYTEVVQAGVAFRQNLPVANLAPGTYILTVQGEQVYANRTLIRMD